jgi:dUTP pyrophosphatase
LSAGLDISSAVDITIPAGIRKPTRVPVGIAIELLPGTYGRLTGRSSSTMNGLMVMDGVIDADYRGPIDVMTVNISNEDIVIKQGQRIAQLIVEKVLLPEVVVSEKLSETKRDVKGFGSTGKY